MKKIPPQIYKYCAYQERCKREVREKLLTLGLEPEHLEEAIAHLEAHRFLDESRYVKSFVRGKFTFQHWGRRKIAFELSKKGIPAHLIEDALANEIDVEAYEACLIRLIRQKRKQYRKDDAYKQRQKIARFLTQKGFEWDAFRALLEEG